MGFMLFYCHWWYVYARMRVCDKPAIIIITLMIYIYIVITGPRTNYHCSVYLL